MIIIKQSAMPHIKFPIRAITQQAQGLIKNDEAPKIRAEEISSTMATMSIFLRPNLVQRHTATGENKPKVTYHPLITIPCIFIENQGQCLVINKGNRDPETVFKKQQNKMIMKHTTNISLFSRESSLHCTGSSISISKALGFTQSIIAVFSKSFIKR